MFVINRLKTSPCTADPDCTLQFLKKDGSEWEFIADKTSPIGPRKCAYMFRTTGGVQKLSFDICLISNVELLGHRGLTIQTQLNNAIYGDWVNVLRYSPGKYVNIVMSIVVSDQVSVDEEDLDTSYEELITWVINTTAPIHFKVKNVQLI